MKKTMINDQNYVKASLFGWFSIKKLSKLPIGKAKKKIMIKRVASIFLIKIIKRDQIQKVLCFQIESFHFCKNVSSQFLLSAKG